MNASRKQRHLQTWLTVPIIYVKNYFLQSKNFPGIHFVCVFIWCVKNAFLKVKCENLISAFWYLLLRLTKRFGINNNKIQQTKGIQCRQDRNWQKIWMVSEKWGKMVFTYNNEKKIRSGDYVFDFFPSSFSNVWWLNISNTSAFSEISILYLTGNLITSSLNQRRYAWNWEFVITIRFFRSDKMKWLEMICVYDGKSGSWGDMRKVFFLFQRVWLKLCILAAGSVLLTRRYNLLCTSSEYNLNSWRKICIYSDNVLVQLIQWRQKGQYLMRSLLKPFQIAYQCQGKNLH